MSVIGVILLAILAYLYFSVMKNNAQIEKGYKSYVKSNYTQVLNDYDDLNGKNLDKEALYIYAKATLKQINKAWKKIKRELIKQYYTKFE